MRRDLLLNHGSAENPCQHIKTPDNIHLMMDAQQSIRAKSDARLR
jgi:hypothetical protein